MSGLTKRSLDGIRMFLLQQEVDVAATADEEQICGSLYRFLVEHRADASLWRGLTQSIRDTGCQSIRLVPKAGTSASFCSVAADVARLRAALPTKLSDSRSTYDIFKKGLNAGVLSVFLSVGVGFTMTGCPDSEENVDLTEDSGTPPDETDTISDVIPIDTESESALTDAGSEPVLTDTDSEPTDTGADEVCTPTGEELTGNQIDDDCDGIVDCDPIDKSGACTAGNALQDVVIAACITPDEKETLCECFSDLPDDWVAGLTDLFANGTAAEIAAVLDQMVICSNYTNLPNDKTAFDSIEDSLKAGTLCQEYIAIYLAVPFND